MIARYILASFGRHKARTAIMTLALLVVTAMLVALNNSIESLQRQVVEIVEMRYDRRFRADEVELARGLAEQAAVAIRNARLFRELESRNRQLSLLNERLKAFVDLSEGMRGLSDEEQMLRLLGRVMDEVLGEAKPEVWVSDLFSAQLKNPAPQQ